MKYFNLISILFFGFFSSVVFALEPAPTTPPRALVGSFIYSGHFKIWRKTHAEILDVRNKKDQQKLTDLQDQEYECTLRVNQQYVCQTEVAVSTSELEVQIRIDRKYQGTRLDFEPEVGSPQLVFDGDSYKRWTVSQPVILEQNVSVGTDVTQLYKVADYDHVGSLLKIYPGGANAQTGFCVVPSAAGDLEIQETVRIQPSRFEMNTYFLTILLERK